MTSPSLTGGNITSLLFVYKEELIPIACNLKEYQKPLASKLLLIFSPCLAPIPLRGPALNSELALRLKLPCHANVAWGGKKALIRC